MRLVFLAALSWTVLACAGPNRDGHLQEAAQELNVNARFGRMTFALEHVAEKERDSFADRHKGWGGAVRVTDADLVGMRIVSEHAADIIVRIGWHRPEEQELRITTVRQRYEDTTGEWLLVGESRADGDVGLLGEPVVVEAPVGRRPPAHFPTVTLGRRQTAD